MKRKVLRESLKCEREMLCRIWGGRSESTRSSVNREAGCQVWWQGIIKETEGKGGYLEKYPFFDWEQLDMYNINGST